MAFVPKFPTWNLEVEVYKLNAELRTYSLHGETITGQLYTPQRTQDEDERDTQYFVFPKEDDLLRGFADYENVGLGDVIVFGFPTNAPRQVGFMVRVVQPRWLRFPNEHLIATMRILTPNELELVIEGEPFPFEPVVDDDCIVGLVGIDVLETLALDIEDFRQVRITSSFPQAEIHGIGGGSSCRHLRIWNVGAETINLIMESSAASSTNRLAGPLDIRLLTGQGCFAWYDQAAQRWRIDGNAAVLADWYESDGGSAALIVEGPQRINCDAETGIDITDGDLPGTSDPGALLALRAASATQQGAVTTGTQTLAGLKQSYDGVGALDEEWPRYNHGANTVYENRIHMQLHFDDSGTPTVDSVDVQLHDAQQIGSGDGLGFGYGGTIAGVVQPRIFFNVDANGAAASAAGYAIDGTPGITGSVAINDGSISFQGGIVVGFVAPTGGGGGGVEDFVDLGDVPSSYSGFAGYLLAVNGSEDGVEFIAAPSGGVEDFVDLGDVPSSYSGFAGYLLAVNGSEDGVEFIAAPSGGVEDFVDLGDVPSSYSGFAGYLLAVNGSEDGVEFVTDPGGGGVEDFTDLGDVPTDYSGAGGYFVRVNGSEDGLEFVAAPYAGGGAGPAPITDNTTGFTASELVDTGDAEINDNFATLLTSVTYIRTALQSLGLLP